VDADVYVAQFSSDRNHMMEDDRWMSPPPPYPPILNEGINIIIFTTIHCLV